MCWRATLLIYHLPSFAHLVFSQLRTSSFSYLATLAHLSSLELPQTYQHSSSYSSSPCHILILQESKHSPALLSPACPCCGCTAPCQHMLLVLGAVIRIQKYQTQIIIARLSLAVLISREDEVENTDQLYLSQK